MFVDILECWITHSLAHARMNLLIQPVTSVLSINEIDNVGLDTAVEVVLGAFSVVDEAA